MYYPNNSAIRAPEEGDIYRCRGLCGKIYENNRGRYCGRSMIMIESGHSNEGNTNTRNLTMCYKCESCGCNMTEFEANISPICDSCFDNEVPPVCGNYDGEDDDDGPAYDTYADYHHGSYDFDESE